MRSAPLLPPELLAAPRNRWDLGVEATLAAMLAFMPLAFGTVDAWSELIVLGFAAVLTLTVVLRVAVDRTYHLPWTWAYLPLALFVLLAAFQLAPLPREWVSRLSPTAAATRDELLAADDMSSAPANSLEVATLSMYPLATAHGLRMVLVGAAVFFVTAATFRTVPQIKRLLLIVFAIGCAEAALALLQIFTRARRLYWVIDAGTDRLTSGSFVNYSNFSQFMNLSIGAGVALLIVRLYEERLAAERRDDHSHAFGGANLAQHGGLLAGLILCALAVLASLSRNGAISMVVAGAVAGTALLISGTLSRRGWVLAMLPLGALALVLMFGFDTIYRRLATIGERDGLSSRWELTLGTLRAWQAFPVWGAGLGTHEYVYPLYDQSTSPYFAGHADNDYAQLLEETGALGALFVGGFLAVIVALLVRLCRRGRTASSAAAFGLAFGLLAVAIHSATDFGQHLPAAFSLSAVACGLAVQLARIDRGATEPSLGRERMAWRRGLAATTVVALALGWGWALRDAYAAHVGEMWWAAAYGLDNAIRTAGPDARDDEYADLLAATDQACRAEPENVLYAYTLNLYRWRAISRDVDPATGRVRLDAEALPLVKRIADELAAVRRLCPTYGPPYAFEGQLRLLVLGEQRGAALIEQGLRLAPYDASTCLIAGEFAARNGRGEKATTLLRRAVALSPDMFSDVIEIALEALKRPAFALELAGDDPARLAELANLAASREADAPLAEQARRATEEALRRRAARGAATPQDLAALAAIDAQRGDNDSAAALYFEALQAKYDQIDWRLARARALLAAGRPREALNEATRCLRLRPEHAAAKALAEELSVQVEAN
jgi:O-antigen ligase/Flp pilus assembly protein TadD